MNFPSAFLTASLVLGPFLLPHWGSGQDTTGEIFLSQENRSSVEMQAVFSHCPRHGYVPVVVKVRNEFETPLTFDITSESQSEHTVKFSTTVTAAPSKSTKATVMLPLMSTFQSSYHPTGQYLRVKLTGIATTELSLSSRFSDQEPACAFSQKLVAGNADKYNHYRHQSTGGYPGHRWKSFAAQFKAEDLPEDWRGYTGLDFLGLPAEEWLTVSPGVRTAILRWVQLGGNLDIFWSQTADFNALQLPGTPGAAYGLGRIRLHQWNASPLDDSFMTTNYAASPHHRISALQVNGIWNLHRMLGERSFGSLAVALILLGFGILVGPVNLFYFARHGRRHRLFFTTPIISLAASLVLVLYILFQDGMGGKGVRFTAMFLNPTEATACVHQQEVSRTGVLFGSGFEFDEPVYASPIILPDNKWTRLKPPHEDYYHYRSRTRSERQTYSLADEKSYAGDYYQSRSEQALLVSSVQATRGRLELVSGGGGTPVLKSSLAFPLDKIFYCDQDGKLWVSAATTTTGQSATLSLSNDIAFKHWRSSMADFANPYLAKKIMEQTAQPGHFYAESNDPSAGTLTTLDSIDWDASFTYLWGPVAKP